MRLKQSLLLPVLFISLFISSCTIYRPAGTGKLPPADIELTTTPFFEQDDFQCGPAALAALLVSSDVPTLPDLLSPDLYIPKREGTLQLEIIASIRQHNRVPYQIHPEMDAITAELQAGRVVMVLQNIGLKTLPTYHYAVVIGIQRNGQIILRSGITERLLMDMDDFLVSWENAGSWGILSLKPGELPADKDINRYLQAVARVESSGNTLLAEQCYSAVLELYPNNGLATFGLANTMFSSGDYISAAAVYSYLLKYNPGHAGAVNNLAESLAALECYQPALELLDAFLQSEPEQSEMKNFLTLTRKEINERFTAAGRKNIDCSEVFNIIRFSEDSEQ